MKFTTIFSVLLVISHFGLIGQNNKAAISSTAKVNSIGTKSPQFTAQLLGKIKPLTVDLKWKPILINKCVKHHSENDVLLDSIKLEKKLNKATAILRTNQSENNSDELNVTPVVGANFLGNTNTGHSPLDNSIAISNGGKIVSVANNSIEFYNTNGTLTYSNSINSFFNDPSITNVCDPLIIYDSGADKFIFFAQECSGVSTNSNILICFSQTNDPNGNWWNYKLTGNPLANDTWFDYPKMAVSNNELYITGNSFSNSGVFQEALLYQIEKNNGFIGGSMNWQYWHDISASPFTLLPVSYGQQGNYGPGCYFVATKSSGAATIDLFDLTNDMSADDEQLNHYSISTSAYSPAADGNQLGTSRQLDNGDCRALSGFYLNGIIHFVFHSDYSNGYNGINYNRLNVNTQTNSSSKYGLANYEYSYPSVASFATTATDKSVMIGFGRTGSSIYPEIRVVNCDNNMLWGSSVLVKAGVSYSDYTASGNASERWGDYTGMCRKHNSTNVSVWMNGMYGANNHNWETWISEISGTVGSDRVEEITKSNHFVLYPNPIYSEFKTEFTLDIPSKINIEIYDIQGKLVKILYRGSAHAGINIFTFNKSNLEAGTYTLIINTNDKPLHHEKIIISN